VGTDEVGGEEEVGDAAGVGGLGWAEGVGAGEWGEGGAFFDDDDAAEEFGIASVGEEGADLGLIRQIDVAPTLCLLLGIEPPAQATGVILRSALGRSAPMPPFR